MRLVQVGVLIFQLLGLAYTLHVDFAGRPAKKPKGWGGAAVTLWIWTFIQILYYFAGTYSALTSEAK